jgi:nifR3 family TIM-barrel protein
MARAKLYGDPHTTMDPNGLTASLPQDRPGASSAALPEAPPLPPLRLGSLVIDPPLFLAPMAGFTNVAFRRIARRLGCGLTATEMVMAEGVVRGYEKTMALAALSEEERPGVVQIAGGDPHVMGEAAAILVDRGADAIDVNMGCPVRKIVDRCAGSALLKDPSTAAAVVAGIKRRVSVPVTVKMRAGWDDAGECIAVARALEAEGVAALAVHGRTRAQQYTGRASRDAIRAVKEAVRVPVIGNGDVVTPADVLDMVRETGVDGVMIGRAALWDPWIFREAALALRERRVPPPPTGAERRAILAEYFDETALARGERTAVLSMRKFASLYLRGFAGARRLRSRIQTMETRQDFFEVIDAVFEDDAPPARPDFGAPGVGAIGE